MPSSSDPLDQISAIVAKERAALLRVARSEGLSAEDALECVQDALCKYLSLAKTEALDDSHAVGRLKTMVRNQARNARRLHHRSRTHLPPEESQLSSEEDPEQHLAYAESIVRLQGCVAELCTIQRAVVMLRLLEERSGQDVAEEIGISRPHVDVLLSRARASLRVCMRHPPGSS